MARRFGRPRSLGFAVALPVGLLLAVCGAWGGIGAFGLADPLPRASSVPEPETLSPPSGETANLGASGVLASAAFSSTGTDFPNPDRGFFGWSGNDFLNGFDAGSAQVAYNAGQRLVLAKVQLDAYRGTDITESMLVALDGRFGELRSLGLKATLLFNYDFSAGGNDASAAQIKRHLEQLKPVLAANADVIPYMRAGFVGAWGEWHSSKSGNSCGYNSGTTTCATADINRAIVRDALLANVPATTQIGFRMPADLIKWYPSATQQSRAGMHNDCFLSGPSDTGTYTSTAQRSYVQALTAKTAFGGETCTGEQPARNSCSDILAEGPAYHLAWFNSSDWAGYITAWRNGGCLAKVSSSMGYRLQLDGVSHDTSVARGGSVVVNVDLRNVGWARMFTARKLVVTLRNRSTGATISGSGGDLSALTPQATSSSRVAVGVAIPADALAGDYDVYLSAPDIFPTTAGNTRYAVRFANADNASLGQAWDATTARFKAGQTLKIN